MVSDYCRGWYAHGKFLLRQKVPENRKKVDNPQDSTFNSRQEKLNQTVQDVGRNIGSPEDRKAVKVPIKLKGLP